MNKTADNVVARSRGTRRSPNLALKSKAVEYEKCYEEEEEEEGCSQEDTKYAYSEHMALASRAFWNNKKNFNAYLRYYMSDHRPMWMEFKI